MVTKARKLRKRRTRRRCMSWPQMLMKRLQAAVKLRERTEKGFLIKLVKMQRRGRPASSRRAHSVSKKPYLRTLGLIFLFTAAGAVRSLFCLTFVCFMKEKRVWHWGGTVCRGPEADGGPAGEAGPRLGPPLHRTLQQRHTLCPGAHSGQQTRHSHPHK